MGNPGLCGADLSVPKLVAGGISVFVHVNRTRAGLLLEHRQDLGLRKHGCQRLRQPSAPGKVSWLMPTFIWSGGERLHRYLGAWDQGSGLAHVGTKALSDAPPEALFLNYSHFLNKGYQVIHTFYQAVLFVWICVFSLNIKKNKAKLTDLLTK